MAADLGVTNLKVLSRSLLVTRQLTGAFNAKEEMLIKYLDKVKKRKLMFKSFELTHVPSEKNSKADILAKVSSTNKPDNNHSVIQEKSHNPA